MIYLMANQIPLLDIASPLPIRPTAAEREEAAPQGSSLGRMVDMIDQARTGMPADRLATMAAPTVVAFTDPNDLLSYRLISTMLDVTRARLINVIATNETTWFGFLERPDLAHCGYPWNRAVIGLIAHGHKAGEPLPQAPDLGSGKCS
jgi:hypothetical protein